MIRQNYSAVVLAAGYSSRMNEWKPAILINNIPLLFYSLKTLIKVCSDIVVIGGYNFNKLQSLIDDFSNTYNFPLKCVENKFYESGMFSTVKKGIENITSDNIFIALSDIPFVKSETYKKMIEFRETTDEKPDVIYPVNYKDKSETLERGHPVLINKKIKQRILSETENIMLNILLREFIGVNCFVNDEAINFDIDTQADLKKAKDLFANGF